MVIVLYFSFVQKYKILKFFRDAFFTIHTYGQFWFTPWGYTASLPSDYADLKAKSDVGAAAIRAVYGTTYTVGSSTVLLCKFS